MKRIIEKILLMQNTRCAIYNEQDILREKLRVLNESKMMDFVCEVYNEIYPKNQIPDGN